MLSYISNNIGTILVGAGVIVIIALIIRSIVKNKRKGKSSCGCSCSNCPSSGICRK